MLVTTGLQNDETGKGQLAPIGSGAEHSVPESRVRAVVVNYNGAAYTLSCVLSLLSQHHSPLDVVVVDNGSAAEDVERLRLGLPAGVLLVRSKHNLGYAGGVNLGARSTELARPTYILALNNDLSFPDQNMVTALIRAIEGNSRRVAASPLVSAADVDLPVEEQTQVRRVPDYWTLLVTGSGWLRRMPGLRRRAFLFAYGDHLPYQLGRIYDCESINGSCFLISADFLERIGFLDEGTFLFFEELVLGRQILDCGRIAALTAASRVIHQQGRTTGHGGKRVRLAMLREMVRSELHYCQKYLACGATQLLVLRLVRVVDIATKMALVPVRRATQALTHAHV